MIDQLTFADFLSRGEFDYHLRRMRPIHRSRQDALLDGLRRHLPESTAGRHLGRTTRHGLAAARSGRAASRRRGRAPRHRRIRPGAVPAWLARPDGLIFGYAGLMESQIGEGVKRLARAIDEVRAAAA